MRKIKCKNTTHNTDASYFESLKQFCRRMRLLINAIKYVYCLLGWVL